jgi:hypothetical protein
MLAGMNSIDHGIKNKTGQSLTNRKRWRLLIRDEEWYELIRQTPWKVAVLDRLDRVPEDAYFNLHSAETSRVLLLRMDQLMAVLPSIRQRAATYLPIDDPRRVALGGMTDLSAAARRP